MNRLNSRQIEAFQAVMQLGSMTRAAELLDISQPAVSRLIVDLTEAVGFQLFTRRRGGMAPTPEAQRFYEQVRKLFIGMDELTRSADAIRSLNEGELRIAALSLYANGILPQIVARFLDAYPGLTVSIESSPGNDIIDKVASNRCDVGIATLPAYTGDLRVDQLDSRPALCVMPVGSALADKEAVQLRDLEGQPFVSFPRSSSFRFQVDTLFQRGGVERQLRAEATTHEAVCNLVAAGVGVSVVSPFSPHLGQDPRLVFRPFRPAIPIEIGLVTDEARLSAAGAAFRDHARAYFEKAKRGGAKPAPAGRRAAPVGG